MVLFVLSLLVSDTVPVSLRDLGVAAVAALTGLLALEHLAVADNAVALALGNVVAILGLLASGGCPGEVITANLHVVVGELAELVVVHTEKLSLLRSAEVKTRNKVYAVRNQGTHDKCVGGARNDVSNLLVDRSEVASKETTEVRCDLSVATKTNNVVGTEEGVEKQADHSSDAVLSEHIHRVIDPDPVLDLSREVGNNAGDDAEDNRAPRSDETRSRSGGDETRNEAGAPADHRPLARQAPIKEDPGHGAEDTSEVGVPAGHRSAEVSTEGRATVECEPAEPEEDSAEGDERDVVRAEVEHHLLLAASENHGVGERRHTRDNLDGSTTGVVEDTPAEGPTARSPHPASDGAVDERGPDEGENEERHEAAALSDGTCDNGGGNGAELHLVESEEKVGDECRAGTGYGESVHETKFPEVADEAVCRGLAECERVSPEVPLEADDRV